MFSNIGKKIKVLAKVFCWIGIIFSFVTGILMGSGTSYLATLSNTISGDAAAFATSSIGVFGGIIFIVVGSLISWISSFVLYGFGELVDNSSELVYLKTHERRS